MERGREEIMDFSKRDSEDELPREMGAEFLRDKNLKKERIRRIIKNKRVKDKSQKDRKIKANHKQNPKRKRVRRKPKEVAPKKNLL